MLHVFASFFARFRWPLVLALPVCLSVLSPVIHAETLGQREDRIKAALIFKLVKFVDWPVATLAGKDPLQICSLGSSGVGEALAAVDGKPARDRLAQFRKIGSLSSVDVKGCHVLFIPSGTNEIASGIASTLRGRPVLTISDAPDFARRGGMIGMIRGENKITFEINLRSARESGLEPGTPLLELATIIE